ncbi:MAG: hypothetical protein AB2L11_03505 [Syntrophobacteraceae bacterium]
MNVRYRIILAVSVFVAAFPILVVEMPMVMDYPNHLARIWLLSGGNSANPLSSIYQSDWTRASTNIAVDAFGATLAHFFSLGIVSKILLTIMFIGPPIGAAFLNRSVFKSTNSWQISFFILTWTTTAIAGFMSYQIGLFAALSAACIDLRMSGSSFSLLLRRTLTGALLLTIHPFALLFYVILVAGLIIGEKAVTLSERSRLVLIAKSMGMPAVAAAIPLLMLFLLAPYPPGSYGSTKPPLIAWHISAKTIFESLISPFMTYQSQIDIALTASVVGILLWSALSGNIRIHFGLGISACILFLFALIAPSSIGDACWLQRRFPLMAILTLMAAVKPDPGLKRHGELLLAAILLATLCIRASWIANIWIERQSDLHSLYAATKNIPAGSAIMPIQQLPADWREAPLGRSMVGGPGRIRSVERHFPALLVIKNQVFIPTLFSIPGQQPLVVLPPWNEISVYQSGIPSPGDFLSPTEKRIKSDPYLLQWRSRFDYVLVINADLQTVVKPFVVPEGLRLEVDTGYAKLFRVIREDFPCSKN